MMSTATVVVVLGALSSVLLLALALNGTVARPRGRRALLLVSALVLLAVPVFVVQRVSARQSTAAAQCYRWQESEGPQVRFKGVSLGNRYMPSTTNGVSTPYLAVVDVNYQRRIYIIATQDGGYWERPWLDSDPAGFSVVIHQLDDGRLRLKVSGSQYISYEWFIYDTGIDLVPAPCATASPPL